ncbi:MAG TPA: Fic family protein, partial [Armatimonadota bacterium]|nr:Fic family protein [Armatimonadota bacterium]
MARWDRQHWDGDPSGMSRADRASGTFEAYIPDPLMGRIVPLATDTARLLAQADRAVAGMGQGDRTAHLGDLAGLLLRTEAAASSWIEGIPPRARQVAFAALAQEEDDLKRPGEAAQLVANNIHIMRTAVAEMAGVGALTVEQLVGLQEDLVLDHRAHGLRRTQNWIGGSPGHPLTAAFVPPPPEHVQSLLNDLVTYLNDALVLAPSMLLD